MTVYEVASGEMWPDFMYDSVDAVGIGEAMLPNYQLGYSMYYVGTIFVCMFLMVNVFVGVIIEKYNENKDLSEGQGMLTEGQLVWVNTMKMAMSSKAPRIDRPPKNCLPGPRRLLFNFINAPLSRPSTSYFDNFIMICIAEYPPDGFNVR